MADPVVNFGKVSVSTTYDASAVSVVLATGEGARLPVPSVSGAFNLTWWNYTDYPDPSDDPNREIVRCTARTSDTLTITRAQESTSASTKNTAGKTYKMVLAPTKKFMDDIYAALGTPTKETFATTALTTTLTLANTPIANTSTLIYQTAVLFEGSNYTISGVTVTLLFTPEDATTMQIIYRY